MEAVIICESVCLRLSHSRKHGQLQFADLSIFLRCTIDAHKLKFRVRSDLLKYRCQLLAIFAATEQDDLATNRCKKISRRAHYLCHSVSRFRYLLSGLGFQFVEAHVSDHRGAPRNQRQVTQDHQRQHDLLPHCGRRKTRVRHLAEEI